jgi:hypothetical protein
MSTKRTKEKREQDCYECELKLHFFLGHAMKINSDVDQERITIKPKEEEEYFFYTYLNTIKNIADEFKADVLINWHKRELELRFSLFV